MVNTCNSCDAMPNSVGVKGDFWHFRSSQQHANGCI